MTAKKRYEQCAEEIGTRFVYSAKANPANVAMPRLNEDVIREELRRITQCCEKNGCNYEIVLKDISTVSGQPENLDRWAQIAREFIHDRVERETVLSFQPLIVSFKNTITRLERKNRLPFRNLKMILKFLDKL